MMLIPKVHPKEKRLNNSKNLNPSGVLNSINKSLDLKIAPRAFASHARSDLQSIVLVHCNPPAFWVLQRLGNPKLMWSFRMDQFKSCIRCNFRSGKIVAKIGRRNISIHQRWGMLQNLVITWHILPKNWKTLERRSCFARPGREHIQKISKKW